MDKFTPEQQKELRERFWDDPRNLRDQFKGMCNEDIMQMLLHNHLLNPPHT